jgi:hypothetical protein
MLMVAPYSVKGAAFVPGKPRVWSRQPVVVDAGDGSRYSVSPDGRRVLAVVPDQPSEEYFRRHVTVWVNALGEFRRRVPVDR